MTLKGIKAKEIKVELTSVDAYDVLSVCALKKWRMRVLQRRKELGDDPQSGRPANSGLNQVIAELIREYPFLSCKIFCRYLKVSKETCLRFLHEKFRLKKFHLRWVSHQLILNMKA
jgi:hypothetical protein